MLVDPWLVGKLTFGGLDFVYAGSKREAGSGRRMGGPLVESRTTFLANPACGCAGGLSWPLRCLQWPSTAVGVHMACQGGVAFSCTLYCRHSWFAGVAREDTLDIDQIAAETDFILLTQGIDDHAHR